MVVALMAMTHLNGRNVASDRGDKSQCHALWCVAPSESKIESKIVNHLQ